MKDFRERCLELLKDEEVVGLSVLTTNKEEITNSFTYKYADLENQIPTSLDNIYRIASVSKIEVALAIMKLVEQGKLDIKEDVSKYLGFKFRNPYFPNDIITLEMIMTQTSSLNDGVEDGALGYEGVNGRHAFVDLNTLINDETYEYYTKDTFLNKPSFEILLTLNTTSPMVAVFFGYMAVNSRPTMCLMSSSLEIPSTSQAPTYWESRNTVTRVARRYISSNL